MKVVIMAGGQGTRFWPWSVKDRPKQFLSLLSEESMIQQTYLRFEKRIPKEKIYIVTKEDYVSIVEEQIPLINKKQIIVEPASRDTGPCMALTALHFLKEGDDEAFAAVPADHFFPDDESITQIFSLAEKIAEIEKGIVTLGIKPLWPETGYGYILAENDAAIDSRVLNVKQFIEKPDLEKAEELLNTENVFWNSGIFIWKPSTIYYYMEKLQPEIWELLTNDQDFKSRYSLLPKISVDYAILEKAQQIYTIPYNIQWDDVGTWIAWERLNKKENESNLIQGDVHILSVDNCIIKSDKQKAIVVGVKDLIIVSTESGLLVCDKSQEKKIKEVLKNIIKDKI